MLKVDLLRTAGTIPLPKNKFNRQKENNAIFNSAVYEILMHENQKVSAEKEAHKNIQSEFDENNIYQIDNMSLEYTKENLNYVSVHLNANLKIHMGLIIRMI